MGEITHCDLKDFLVKHDVLETEEGKEARLTVLEALHNCLNDWLQHIMTEVPKYAGKDIHGKLHPFGSFALGTNSKGGDLDCLVIIDQLVDNSDIFSSFYEFVRKHLNPSTSRSFGTTSVPVLFFVIDHVEVDLVFVSSDHFQGATVSPSDDAVLEFLDRPTILKMNGFRETMLIKELTPNQEAFRIATLAIKLWAKKKLLYGEALGSLPGIALTIMMSYICSKEPKTSTPEQILMSFFSTYDSWDWSNPVMLRPLKENFLNLDQYDPQVDGTSSLHEMKVVTPVYPEMSVTLLLNPGSLCRLKRTLKTGRVECSECLNGSRDWGELFTQSTQVLSIYRILMMVEAVSKKDSKDWLGVVKSKVRLLTERMSQNAGVKECWLVPRLFPQSSDDSVCWRWFVGIIPSEETPDRSSELDLSPDIQHFHTLVKTKSQEANMDSEENALSVKPIKHSNLREYMDEDVLKLLV